MAESQTTAAAAPPAKPRRAKAAKPKQPPRVKLTSKKGGSVTLPAKT